VAVVDKKRALILVWQKRSCLEGSNSARFLHPPTWPTWGWVVRLSVRWKWL